MSPKERLFNKYHSIAFTVARRFAFKFNRPVRETQDYADFALALLLYEDSGYDPARGELRKWLEIKVHWHLQEIYIRGRHHRLTNLKEPTFYQHHEIPCTEQMQEWERGEGGSAPQGLIAKPNAIQQLLQEVGEEGAALVRIIMDAPHDLLEEVCPHRGRTRKKKRGNLTSYLVDVLDWPETKVNKAFGEIEVCLSQ